MNVYQLLPVARLQRSGVGSVPHRLLRDALIH
jgi:hypothetical protein